MGWLLLIAVGTTTKSTKSAKGSRPRPKLRSTCEQTHAGTHIANQELRSTRSRQSSAWQPPFLAQRLPRSLRASHAARSNPMPSHRLGRLERHARMRGYRRHCHRGRAAHVRPQRGLRYRRSKPLHRACRKQQRSSKCKRLPRALFAPAFGRMPYQHLDRRLRTRLLRPAPRPLNASHARQRHRARLWLGTRPIPKATRPKATRPKATRLGCLLRPPPEAYPPN